VLATNIAELSLIFAQQEHAGVWEELDWDDNDFDDDDDDDDDGIDGEPDGEKK
jgi:hypothetical protein